MIYVFEFRGRRKLTKKHKITKKIFFKVIRPVEPIFVLAKSFEHAKERLKDVSYLSFKKATPCSNAWNGMFDNETVIYKDEEWENE